ncbi:MAG: mechanosensitive ion channel family protein [Candidatus Omnitrophica bacterium]|nr:mechanosensitive ion channel family protein [Candidatus Omnitrophota bacterium]
MKNFGIFGIDIHPAVYIPVLYFFWVSVLLLLKKLIYGRIKRFAERTATRFDDIFLSALDLPLLLLIFVSGIFVLENLFGFGMDTELLRVVDAAFKVTAIIAVIIFIDRLFNGLIENYSNRVQILKGSTGVARLVVKSVVMGLGLLILLDNFGVSITPILASLGVGSLAVALALQPTLENFFSGIQIIMDKPVVAGQFIRLESGEEGYVQKIGWRSTWVRMLPNNVVVIPNKVMVSSRILNYHYPEKEISILVQVGVGYDSDLEHVERVTIETGEEILKKVEGGVGDFKPFIRYHTFDDFSINFTVILRAKEFVDGYLIKHEFIKRLHKRYKDEGIVIPFPIRTLEWDKDLPPVRVSGDKGRGPSV